MKILKEKKEKGHGDFEQIFYTSYFSGTKAGRRIIFWGHVDIY